MMWYWWGPYNSPFGWFMPIFMLAFWIVIVALVIKAVRHFGTSDRGSRGSAREELDARYARGEINREEYLEKKRDLTA